MATYTVANITDPLGNPNWAFDGSGNFNGNPGVGLTIGFVTPVPETNSVNVTGGYYVNSVNISSTYLTQTAAAATYAPIVSPTFTGTATAPTLKATTAFDLNSVNIVTGKAHFQSASRLSPTGTTSTSGVMMGMGGAATITPALTGTILITLSGSVLLSAAGSTMIQLVQGTGTAPANGAAPTGTVIGGEAQFEATSGTLFVPFSLTAVVSGLTVGTAIWIDAEVSVSAGTITAQLATVEITAVEV